jgi:hypothetical protein
LWSPCLVDFFLKLVKNEGSDSEKVSSRRQKDLLMKIITGTLIKADSIDAVRNLWELTLMIDGSLNTKKYMVRSTYPFRNDEIRRFKLTLKGSEVIKIEPLS